MPRYIKEQLIASLKIGNYLQIMSMINQNEHIPAFKALNQREFCNKCCNTFNYEPRTQFMVNKNSKRGVHLALFWIRILGPNYPLNDFLFTNLELKKKLKCQCGYGINTYTGHSISKIKACINPKHYNCNFDIIKNIVYENIDIIYENIKLIEPSQEFESFISYIITIKNNIHPINLIDIIRSQCPPVNDNFYNYDINNEWILDDLETIFTSTDADVYSNYKNLKSNQLFNHRCEIDKQLSIINSNTSNANFDSLELLSSVAAFATKLPILDTQLSKKVIVEEDIKKTAGKLVEISVPRIGQGVFKLGDKSVDKSKVKIIPIILIE